VSQGIFIIYRKPIKMKQILIPYKNISMHNQSIRTFLWHHIRPYKWLYAVMLMAPIITSFYPLAYNYALKLFLDAMSGADPIHYKSILFPIVLFITTQLSLDLVWRVSDMARWKAEPYVRRSILSESYDYVQHHSYAFFQDNFTGAISSKLKGLLDGYDKFWSEIHHGMFSNLIKIVVNISALTIINRRLGLFVLIWGLLYLLLIFNLSKHINQLAKKESESRHVLIGQISDKITNIISLLSFASRKREVTGLNQQINKYYIPKQIRVYKYDFKIQLIAGFLYLVKFTFVLFYVLYLKNKGHITIGDFIFVLGLTLVVSEDVWKITQLMQTFARAMGDFKSALTILQIPHTMLDKPKAKDLVIKKPSVEFRGVVFGYGSTPDCHPRLDRGSIVPPLDPRLREDDKMRAGMTDRYVFTNLTLSIKPGEKIGVVGESGAGKSTLVSLLLRYFNVGQGEILIDGKNIA